MARELIWLQVCIVEYMSASMNSRDGKSVTGEQNVDLIEMNLWWDVAQSFMYQLCTGLAHCHGHGVMHRYICRFL